MQVTTLKECRCNVIGAVLNRVRNEVAGSLLFVWMLAGIHLQLEGVMSADEVLQPAATPAPVLSGTTTARLAPWQERLTLGSGDVLDISIFDQPDSARSGVVIGPDGRLNYLQVRDLPATGLTVDELRDRLDTALAKYYVAPRTIVIPAGFRSKKCYLLGAVQQRGVITMERPITVIEAIAQGGGFVSALENQNVSLMVDLGRSFLVRRNETNEFSRFPVNFEALFLEGDLTQNITLAPDDYLYFPPLGVQQIYLVGDIKGPGTTPYTKEMSVMAAIAARGGFTDKAWKSKILVIRGSLNNPQTFVINVNDILKGKAKDFPLLNRDIVYVSRKPWAYAQEILEEGINQFLYAAVIGYTGQHVGPWIKEPIIK